MNILVTLSVGEFGVLTLPILRVTEERRHRLLEELEKVGATGINISSLSCQSLSRFANAFLDSFYPHVPIVHIPTFNLDDCDAKTILAMTALGAQCRHEHRKAVMLFFAAKALLKEETQEKERNALTLKHASAQSANCANEDQAISPDDRTCGEPMSEARCALYLIAFATWQSKPEIVREAFNLQSFLARCVRESGLEESQETLRAAPLDWHTWVEQETNRRIKLNYLCSVALHECAWIQHTG